MLSSRTSTVGLVLVSLGFHVWCARLLRGEPAPASPEELEAGSDLIVEVDVLSVSLLGSDAGWAYEARLQIRRVLKGTPPANPMPYRFLPPSPGVLGEINENVFAGDRLRLYLVRDQYGWYVAWRSNSIELLEDRPESRRKLPQEFGEVFYADGRGAAPVSPARGYRAPADNGRCQLILYNARPYCTGRCATGRVLRRTLPICVRVARRR